jgi:hypothetical protein
MSKAKTNIFHCSTFDHIQKGAQMNATTTATNKRRWNSIVLAILLALMVTGGGPMISQQASTPPAAHLTSQQVYTSTNGDMLSGFVTNLITLPEAYADGGCEGIDPPSNLDCPPTPTPTATPDPGR